MSSYARSFASPKEGLTRFLKADSPAYPYIDDGDIPLDRLFPFTYSNGVLNITYEGNNFKERMVDISGNSPSGETEPACRVMGGPRLATAIGDRFKAYIRAWRASTIDAGSAIEVFTPGQVIRVQECDNAVSSTSGNSYEISTQAPVSDNFITGSDANSYRTTYIFKTPLTVTIIESGVKKYITFRTIMDQE